MAKIEIEISGYGGEIVIGEISKEAYNYWSKRERSELETYTWNPENSETEIPEDANLFSEDHPWFECDDQTHYWGCDMSSTVRISVDGNEIFKGEIANLSNQIDEATDYDVESVSYRDEVNEDTLPSGYYFMGLSLEKGQFWYSDFEVEKFDINKVSFTFGEIMGEDYLNSVEYAGDELDNQGGSTTGKGCEVEVFAV